MILMLLQLQHKLLLTIIFFDKNNLIDNEKSWLQRKDQGSMSISWQNDPEVTNLTKVGSDAMKSSYFNSKSIPMAEIQLKD